MVQLCYLRLYLGHGNCLPLSVAMDGTDGLGPIETVKMYGYFQKQHCFLKLM